MGNQEGRRIRSRVRAGGDAGGIRQAARGRSGVCQTGDGRHRRLSRSDPKAAIKSYDELAADRGAGQVIQDLAALRAGFLLVDNSTYADMRTRLEPLTAAERPFRYSARELLALSAWKQGDMSAARQWTDMIMTDPQTPAGARSRAQVLSELIAAGGKG